MALTWHLPQPAWRVDDAFSDTGLRAERRRWRLARPESDLQDLEQACHQLEAYLRWRLEALVAGTLLLEIALHRSDAGYV